MSEEKTTHEIFTEKLADNAVINEFYEFDLIGGAVIDIIEDKVPKDYDFDISGDDDKLYNFEKLATKNGFEFICKTNSAITFKRGTIIIQGLFRKPCYFDFTISQARFSRGKNLSFDERSFNSKKLIPTDFSFKKPYNAFLRIPHWRKKGYELPDKTYFSLLSNYRRSLKKAANGEEEGQEQES